MQLIHHERHRCRQFDGHDRRCRTDDDAARQANETSSEQKWFPFGSPGCRLLDELNNGTPQG